MKTYTPGSPIQICKNAEDVLWRIKPASIIVTQTVTLPDYGDCLSVPDVWDSPAEFVAVRKTENTGSARLREVHGIPKIPDDILKRYPIQTRAKREPRTTAEYDNPFIID